jgi:hypothetical protein
VKDLKGQSAALLTNIRLRWKGLPGTTTILIRTFVNCGQKKLYRIGPRSTFSFHFRLIVFLENPLFNFPFFALKFIGTLLVFISFFKSFKILGFNLLFIKHFFFEKHSMFLFHFLLSEIVRSIEQHVLDTNAEKQLSYAAADVYLTLVLKK